MKPTCNFNLAGPGDDKNLTLSICGEAATHRAKNKPKALFCDTCAAWVRDLGIPVRKMTLAKLTG